MTESTSAVVVVGAGPVGLSLALDLAQRGVTVTVIEQRRPAEPPTVRCNHVSSRTMETFRRLGFAHEVRAVGLPDDYPNDVAVRTTATGPELTRIHIPCRNDRFTDKSGPDGWWPTPEPPHRVNQIYFEPIMFGHAHAHPNITIHNRMAVEAVGQGDGLAWATARDLETGEAHRFTGQFVIGCDGGRSLVRKTIGAELVGDAVIQRVQSTYFRAPDLIDRIRKPDAWMSYLYHPERAGNLLAIDGKERWLIHNYLLPDEADFDSVDRDRCIRLLLGVDESFEYEMLANEDWIGRRLVATHLQQDRILICGDASHLWVPYAGYGMNAGIADAMDLSWKLAGYLNGWGGEALVASYEAERLPITDQVSRFAMRHASGAIKERTTIPPEIMTDTPEGEAARKAVGDASYALHVQQFACAGLNYGYFYPESPIIAHDGEEAPGYTMYDYTPSTVPGCRTPHFWLADGSSLYDRLGAEFTLLRFDTAVDVEPLLTATQAAGVPLVLLDATGEIPDVYTHKLLLSRPDRHVAWRGDALPANPDALIARISGRTVAA